MTRLDECSTITAIAITRMRTLANLLDKIVLVAGATGAIGAAVAAAIRQA